MAKRTVAERALTYGSVAVGSALVGAGSVWMGGATYFARRVLTPDLVRPDDTQIHVIHSDSLTLSGTPDLLVPGRYGLWLDGGRGHARIGGVLEVDHRHQRVRRELLGVDCGVLEPGPARFNGYYYGGTPGSNLGLAYEDVAVPTELGPMPAWVVPSEHGDGSRWAVLVHGRGARRHETLRAVPAMHAAGLTSLVPSYRNDGDAPVGPDGRYNLGLSEWRDIEDAIKLALARGAHEIVLVGWSMGGAIVLQFLDRSPLASVVSRAVLDGPVVDWGDVLKHHASLHKVPAPIGHLGSALMGQHWAKRLIGVSESVDVARTNWVERADELSHQMLLIHSRDDEFVPVGPSEALASARPDLISFEPWSLARHCKEWNVDPRRWESVVTEFVR
ncbi:alpha/beta hydrolase family protein [Janibacter limosus]|uniref:alpha/beta hydrolase family protein n=1 Tax=Janibacter limosus TaxID=53458 RepID=UPI001FE11737|nr:alpha/beta hydrolase [Janibacter limosus]